MTTSVLTVMMPKIVEIVADFDTALPGGVEAIFFEEHVVEGAASSPDVVNDFQRMKTNAGLENTPTAVIIQLCEKY